MADDDPIEKFLSEHARAKASEAFDADRAALATADVSGRPSVRYVLVREVGPAGFVFYTNYDSRKARELGDNPYAALGWHWSSIGVQARVEGKVARLADERSDRYFRGRARGSQIGAWASPQSSPIHNRETLESAVEELESRFSGRDVPRPDFWGGYALAPAQIELWYNGGDRLHDRFLYTRQGGRWVTTRLAP